MMGFRHERLAQRLQIGTGNLAEALRSELRERGNPRVLLIGSERASASALDELSPVAHVNHVQRHVPVEAVITARATAKSAQAEILVSIGGGSATGLAKAVALKLPLPIIAVPTTFAGSEATPVWGMTEAGRKETGVERRILPASVIYDTDLLTELPGDVAVTSGVNALAHGIDALWAPRATPLSSADAEAGIRWLGSALRSFESPMAADTVRRFVIGTYLSSTAFGAAGSGMHHKICHVLGGAYDLPHAPLHTVVLPYVLAFNAAADVGSAAIIARALDTEDALSGLLDIYAGINVPRSLASLGLRESDLDEAATRCYEAIPPSNPRTVTLGSVRALLQDAWEGALPQCRRTR